MDRWPGGSVVKYSVLLMALKVTSSIVAQDSR